MADSKKSAVDVVIIGFGWSGAILSKELTEAGLKVVALERGPQRDTYPDGSYPTNADELIFDVRKKLAQNVAQSTFTFRHQPNQTATPIRQQGAIVSGTGVGGSGLHWGGLHFRVLPEDLHLYSHSIERYGRSFIPADMPLQDCGLSYTELEPHFDFAERVFGTAGQAYKVNGAIVGAGNYYAPSRTEPFPLPALAPSYRAEQFQKAANSLGLHPYITPAAHASQPYTNPYGLQMGACSFCGFCTQHVCYRYAKASPNLNILPALKQSPLFELRTQAHVLRINLDQTKKRATGVTYINEHGQTVEQPADLVIVAAFQLHNVRLLLLSGIGQPYDPRTGSGVVGKNFCYQTLSTVDTFYAPDIYTNPFIGAGGASIALDDFNGDHFDHSPWKFIGGASLMVKPDGDKPISQLHLPANTPRWGTEWKKAAKNAFLHQIQLQAQGSNMPSKTAYLDLDPTYKDVFGQALLRITFDWKANDLRMTNYVTEQLKKIAQAMHPTSYAAQTLQPGQHFDTRTYQGGHSFGGAIMGNQPNSSVVNRYLQSWDTHNVFVIGASALPHATAYTPTGLVAALAYWSATAIRKHYLKKPGPLQSPA